MLDFFDRLLPCFGVFVCGGAGRPSIYPPTMMFVFYGLSELCDRDLTAALDFKV